MSAWCSWHSSLVWWGGVVCTPALLWWLCGEHPGCTYLASLRKCTKLFAEKIDASLHILRDSRATLQSLGIYTPGQKIKFSPQPQHKSCTPHFPPQCYHEPQRKKNRFSKHKPSGPQSSFPQPSTWKISFDMLVRAPTDHSSQHQLQLTNASHPFGYHFALFHNWEQITSNWWVLEIILNGYSIHFPSLPAPQHPSPSLFTWVYYV